jgi:acyl-CoA thioesterase
MDRLGIKILEAHQGRSALEMVVSADHLRSLDMAHGGVIASLLDSASGLAAHSLAPLDQVTLTVQLNVNYIRPAFQGETLRAVGKILHSGRRTAVVTSELRTAAGDLVASSSATMMYVAKNQSMPKSTGRG